MTMATSAKALLGRVAYLPLHPAVLRPFRGSRGKAAAGVSPRRIVVVNLTNYLGDCVMTMPLLDRLHETFPDAQIEVVTIEKMASLFKAIPYLSAVHGLSGTLETSRIWNVYQRIVQMKRFVKQKGLKGTVDLAIVPRWGVDPELSAYLAYFTGAPAILGHDPADDTLGHSRLAHVQKILTCTSRGGYGLPHALRELRLLESCGLIAPLDYAVEEARPIHALREILANVNVDGVLSQFSLNQNDRPVLLAPGASRNVKRWPIERFEAVARRLRDEMGAKIVIIGGAVDAAMGAEFEKMSIDGLVNLTGKTSLLETMAILSRAALLISNDSGPGHLGAGLGTPTLVLNATPMTSVTEHVDTPRRIRPVGPFVAVLQPAESANGCTERCTASFAHCILGIPVDLVVRRALALCERAGQVRPLPRLS